MSLIGLATRFLIKFHRIPPIVFENFQNPSTSLKFNLILGFKNFKMFLNSLKTRSDTYIYISFWAKFLKIFLETPMRNPLGLGKYEKWTAFLYGFSTLKTTRVQKRTLSEGTMRDTQLFFSRVWWVKVELHKNWSSEFTKNFCVFCKNNIFSHLIFQFSPSIPCRCVPFRCLSAFHSIFCVFYAVNDHCNGSPSVSR